MSFSLIYGKRPPKGLGEVPIFFCDSSQKFKTLAQPLLAEKYVAEKRKD
jgi:hypothetical protein